MQGERGLGVGLGREENGKTALWGKSAGTSDQWFPGVAEGVAIVPGTGLIGVLVSKGLPGCMGES